MGTFNYVSTEDELKWYCDPEYTLHIYLDAVTITSNKTEIRQWIGECCSGTVYAWNNVSTPVVGEDQWHRKIVPRGDITFYFEDPRDYTFFKLKWG